MPKKARRKEVERCFGILQGRFHVFTRACELWPKDDMNAELRYESRTQDYISRPNYIPETSFANSRVTLYAKPLFTCGVTTPSSFGHASSLAHKCDHK